MNTIEEKWGCPMKNVFQITKKIFIWLIMVMAVFMMVFTVISVTTFNRNDRNLFGYRTYVVMSDSMAATDFKAGSLIFVKEVDPTTLQEGDIITFISQSSESFGEVVTHKIRKLTRDANGNPGFVTYGTTTNTDDATIVTFPYILGKYQTNLPHVGTFFNFLKTPQGYIVCIFLPFMLLILHQGVNTVRLFRRFKSEQLDEMNQEKARLEEERAKNAKIMAQLLALKAQLEGKTADIPISTPDMESVQTPADEEADNADS